MFRERLLSGIVLVIIAALGLYFGGVGLFLGLLAISFIGQMELYRIMKLNKKALGVCGYAATAAFYAMQYFLEDAQRYFVYFVMAFMIILLIVYVFSYPKYKTQEMLLVFFGVFYVAVMLSFIYQTRQLENGIWYVWFIFISSWVSDTFAYCVGMLTGKTIGNHKMSPKLSPKKSIEGAVGGVAGSVIFGCVYGNIIAQNLGNLNNPVLALGLLGGIGALISMVGDLAASAIKRNFDVKDYGKLIPGHGGILDRFDSVIFTAPVIYFLAAEVLPKL